MSNSLQPHRLQHARLLCLSLSSGVCSSSCPLIWWCYLTISPSAALLSFCLQSFPASGSFFNESALCITWTKYWSFSFSNRLSNEYSGLISFRIDLSDLLTVQGTLKSVLEHHNLNNSSMLRLLLQCYLLKNMLIRK